MVQLFPFRDEKLSDEHEGLQKHAMQVMESINDALGMAGQPEELKETLIELGVVHNMNSVKVESFAVSTLITLNQS